MFVDERMALKYHHKMANWDRLLFKFSDNNLTISAYHNQYSTIQSTLYIPLEGIKAREVLKRERENLMTALEKLTGTFSFSWGTGESIRNWESQTLDSILKELGLAAFKVWKLL